MMIGIPRKKQPNRTKLMPSSMIPLARKDRTACIGLLTVWEPSGLGYVSKTLKTVLEQLGQKVLIFAFRSSLSTRLVIHPQWNIPGVYWSKHNRDQLTPEEVGKWVVENNIGSIIIVEPVKKQIWDIVEFLKKSNIRVYGVPMVEITRKYETYQHRLFDATLCVSFTTKDILEQNKVHNCKYIGWGLDANLFIPYHRPESSRKVLFHNAGKGGASWRKNTLAVLKAFRAVLNKGYDALLHIHTQRPWSDYPEELHTVFKSIPSQCIRLTQGDQQFSTIVDYNRNADVCILPSRFEGLGLPFYESLACGVPVITTNRYIMAELIEPNYNGFICKCTYPDISNNPAPLMQSCEVDLRSLTDAIVKAVTCSDLPSMKSNSRSFILSKFTLDKFKNRVADTLGLVHPNDESSWKLSIGANRCMLYISQYFYPPKGGAELSSLKILEDLHELGWDIYALCFNRETEEKFAENQVIKYNNINVIQSSSRSRKSEIENIVSTIRPAFIITQLALTSMVARIAAEKGVPYIIIARGFPEHICSGYWKKNCSFFLNHPDADDLLECDMSCITSNITLSSNMAAFRNSTGVIANSNYTARIFHKFFNVSPIVITPEIDLMKFHPDNRYKREYIGLSKVNPEKGSEIWFSLIKKMPTLRFRSIGLMHKAYVNMPKKLSNFNHLGLINEPHKFYLKCMVFLIPMIGMEGFGRSGVEAAACGTPIVASNRGGLRESLEDVALFIDDYRNPDAWVKAISLILNDWDLRERLIRNGLSRVQSYTNIDRKEILNSFLKGKGL